MKALSNFEFEVKRSCSISCTKCGRFNWIIDLFLLWLGTLLHSSHDKTAALILLHKFVGPLLSLRYSVFCLLHVVTELVNHPILQLQLVVDFCALIVSWCTKIVQLQCRLTLSLVHCCYAVATLLLCCCCVETIPLRVKGFTRRRVKRETEGRNRVRSVKGASSSLWYSVQ